MSLMYTEEQKALIALVKEMAENEIKPYVKDADEKGECPKELYKWDLTWDFICWRFRPSTAELV
jgi:hypothetical protein